MDVLLLNGNTGELKAIKVGWSWTIYLWNYFFGLPLFIRGLYGYAVTRLVALLLVVGLGGYYYLGVLGSTVNPPGWVPHAYRLIGLFIFILDIYMGVKGNELTAKKCNRMNWDFAEPDSAAARYAKQKWGISDATPPPLESAGQGAQ